MGTWPHQQQEQAGVQEMGHVTKADVFLTGCKGS